MRSNRCKPDPLASGLIRQVGGRSTGSIHSNARRSLAEQQAMTDALKALIEKYRGYKMTPAELRDQMISFAYGNAHFENPAITREGVERAVDALLADPERAKMLADLTAEKE